MLTDLSVLAIIGALALVLVSVAMIWVGRALASGVFPLGGKASLRTKSMRGDLDATVAGNRAAGPFFERYGRIVTALAVLVVLVSLVNDITAIVLYVLALAFLGLGGMVCLRKADAAASAISDGPRSEARRTTPESGKSA